MLKNQIFKPLNFFFIAANSLVATGLLTRSTQDIGEWLFLIWGGITGIFLTYRFNDFIDSNSELKFDFKEFFKIKIHLFFVLQLFMLLIPLSFFFLSEFRIIVLFISGVIGFLYSVKFSFLGINIRLKNIFMLKNILIGVCWGSLVLVGADNLNDNKILSLFLFSSLQVFIGSSLRDFTDIKQDTLEYVRSLPIVLGERGAIIFLALCNILSGFVGYFFIGLNLWLLPIFITVIWRQFLLWKVYRNDRKDYWCQKMNLLTCFVIFIGTFIVWNL